jgi:hypothetical protein
MRNEGLTKTLLAGAAILKNRIVVFGADDTHVIMASTATGTSIGISDNLGATAAEDTIDVIMNDIALVTLGGTVTAGDLLTADATGRAITTTTATNRVIGVAMESGVIDDIGSVLISPSLI